MIFSSLITTNMPRKIKQYTNPFLKAKDPLLASGSYVLPNLQSAIALHQQGMLGHAEARYRQLLEIEPRNADVLHLLGVIAYQTGRHQSSVDLIDQAIEINSNVASYHYNRGNALIELKQLDAAVASYDKAIVLKPDYAEAYYNRGNALLELKQLDAAVASYDKAIVLNPDFAEAYSNRGNALQERKQFDAAVASYDKAIALKPDHAVAYLNRGNALLELKQLEAAVASYDKAIALKPYLAEAHSNRGNALLELKQLDAAVASYDKAIALKPYLTEAHSNRGNALQELKQFDAAVDSFDKTIALNPDYAEAYSNRGNAQLELKQLDAAVASYDKAIALKPYLAEAHSNRGNALQELKQFDAAVASYDKAIALKPDHAVAYFSRGIALQELKHFDAAVDSFDKAIALNPDYEYLFGTKLHLKMHLCDWQDFKHNVSELSLKIQSNVKASACFPLLALPIGLADQRKSAEIWNIDKNPPMPSLGSIFKRPRQLKIRIGYYSADFHNHATAYLMAELFERHDKDKFELIAFSYGPDTKDEMQVRIRQSFDHFINVTAMSDKAIAQLSRELSIDISIDLKGLTQDNRLGIFSYRAAPVQVSYLGYPGTLGADYIDYLIADKTLIPTYSQQHYSEKIVYLPNSYQVNDRQRVIAPTQFTKQELGLPQEAFVFCCFNNNYKITPDVFDTWVRILKAVDSSVFWLLEDNPIAAANLRKEAALRGLDPTRLVFANRMDLTEHLARLKVADLFLDTLPCNAHTTASDALWAGLPVLTCMGESFASRVAASLLKAIDLPELVTQTQTDYEALAIELATNTTKLKGIKGKLERNRLTTPLFDTTVFAKHIEIAYTKMYEQYQADLLPDHIYIKNLDTLP
jgi:predicted O-linked N-acetylglucosamine transferase (SPINDLY family)